MTSSSWLDAYLSALTVRDTHEHALKPAYDACPNPYTSILTKAIQTNYLA